MKRKSLSESTNVLSSRERTAPCEPDVIVTGPADTAPSGWHSHGLTGDVLLRLIQEAGSPGAPPAQKNISPDSLLSSQALSWEWLGHGGTRKSQARRGSQRNSYPLAEISDTAEISSQPDNCNIFLYPNPGPGLSPY